MLSVRAQGHQFPSEGFIFDDFDYERKSVPYYYDDISTSWKYVNLATNKNSIYGMNIWCLDYSCNDKGESRMWYQNSWNETSFTNRRNRSALRVSDLLDGQGWVSLEQKSRSYLAEGSDPHIVSGFAAGEGVWASAVRFSSMYDAGDVVGSAHSFQSFWLDAASKAVYIDQNGDANQLWSEADFEWNTHLNGGEGNPDPGPGIHPYIHTGFIEDGGGYTHAMYAYEGEDLYTCYYSPGDPYPASVNSPQDCSDVIGGNGINMFLFIRKGDGMIKFELQSHGWGGVLTMRSDWIIDQYYPIPSQDMRANFSFLISQDGDINKTETMNVDWFYYTPDYDRSSYDIIDDVNAYRYSGSYSISSPIGSRLNTIKINNNPMDLERPYDISDDNPSDLIEDSGLGVSVDGPTQLSTYQSARYVAQLGRLGGYFNIKWRYRNPNGVWSPREDNHGYIYNFIPTQNGCYKIRLEAVRLEYETWIETNDIYVYNKNVCSFGSLDMERSYESGITAMPNPTSGKLNIYTDIYNHDVEYLEIRDILGRTVLREDVLDQRGYYRRELNLTGFPVGVYMFIIRKKHGNETGLFTIAR